MRWYACFGVVALAAFFDVAAVQAHSFKLAVVAPFSGPEAERGQRLLEGFLVATTEADSHPEETSDGHLGGLDSHVLRIDIGGGRASALAAVEGLLADSETQIIAGLIPPGLWPMLGRPLLESGRIYIDMTGRGASVRGLLRLPKVAPERLQRFARTYEDLYGRAPAEFAQRGYAAARLIDRAIRAVGGDMLDGASLRAAFEAAAGDPG